MIRAVAIFSALALLIGAVAGFAYGVWTEEREGYGR